MSITAIVENDSIRLPLHVPDGTRVEITLLPATRAANVARGPMAEAGKSFDGQRNELAGCIKGGSSEQMARRQNNEIGSSVVGRQDAAEDGPTLYELFKDFVGTIEGGPTDVAAEHDHYAHGTPKRNEKRSE